MSKTLTGNVLTASFKVRRNYKENEDVRKKKASQGEYLSALLGTYVDKAGDIEKDTASLIFTGKRTIPVSVVRRYADGTSLCPTDLYDDIKEYYSTFQSGDIQTLWISLREVLHIIPKADKDKMLDEANACTSERQKVCTLMTRMLYYAMRSDLCQYEYPLC